MCALRDMPVEPYLLKNPWSRSIPASNRAQISPSLWEAAQIDLARAPWGESMGSHAALNATTGDQVGEVCMGSCEKHGAPAVMAVSGSAAPGFEASAAGGETGSA